MYRGRRVLLMVVLAMGFLLVQTATAAPEPGREKLDALHELKMAGGGSNQGAVARNFKVLGHHDLGMSETNADVWVHGNFAYVGTWQVPCNGRGVKIVDVSKLRKPELIGTLAAREGTSAEDMVVRRVSTPFFKGDLMAVGIQRCDFENPDLDSQEFGLQLWNVTNPYAPEFITEFGVGHGAGGVHELDMFQRGGHVYALVAHPFGEWFDPAGHGDFMIVDVTNPNLPVMTADWGAGANRFTPGPFWGQGSFGATFGHSARASANGRKAYVSYWDLGILTFDISDVTNPVLLTRTTFKPWEDGDAHSMTPYKGKRKRFILENDEDYDPTTPARIRYGLNGRGIGSESAGSTPLWLEQGHKVVANVVMAASQGCAAADYPGNTAGKIAVVRTPFPDFDPPGATEDPLCAQSEQEAAAEAAGAAAVVHDFIAVNTTPQWFDFGSVGIPVLFTDHETAQGMVEAGRATLRASHPSWGFLRVYDARSGKQVAKFDRAPHVRELPAPEGTWTIHNTEVKGKRAYSSWYSNGIVALDLRPLDRRRPGNPKMVGQFVAPPSEAPFQGMWGVVVRRDGIIFASDFGSGLWIVKPKGKAAP
jgi:hypothetical protein